MDNREDLSEEEEEFRLVPDKDHWEVRQFRRNKLAVIEEPTEDLHIWRRQQKTTTATTLPEEKIQYLASKIWTCFLFLSTQSTRKVSTRKERKSQSGSEMPPNSHCYSTLRLDHTNSFYKCVCPILIILPAFIKNFEIVEMG